MVGMTVLFILLSVNALIMNTFSNLTDKTAACYLSSLRFVYPPLGIFLKIFSITDTAISRISHPTKTNKFLIKSSKDAGINLFSYFFGILVFALHFN